jgi:hypothetical protein
MSKSPLGGHPAARVDVKTKEHNPHVEVIGRQANYCRAAAIQFFNKFTSHHF